MSYNEHRYYQANPKAAKRSRVYSPDPQRVHRYINGNIGQDSGQSNLVGEFIQSISSRRRSQHPSIVNYVQEYDKRDQEINSSEGSKIVSTPETKEQLTRRLRENKSRNNSRSKEPSNHEQLMSQESNRQMLSQERRKTDLRSPKSRISPNQRKSKGKQFLIDEFSKSRGIEVQNQNQTMKNKLDRLDMGLSQIDIDEGPKGQIGAIKCKEISMAEMEMETFRITQRKQKNNEEDEKYEVSEISSVYYPNSGKASFVNQTDFKKSPTLFQKNNSKYGGNGKNKKLMGLVSLQNKKLWQKANTMAKSFEIDIQKNKENDNKSQNFIKKKFTKMKLMDQNQSQENLLEIGISKKKKQIEEDMRKVYIDSYGHELDFAGYYYHCSKFIPNQNDLILTLCWHITPEGKNKVVQTTNYDRTFFEKPYESLYEEAGRDIIMTLMQPLKTNVFKKVKQIKIYGLTTCLAEFSKDGKLLGIYDNRQQTLSVYDSQDIFKCLDMIKQNKHIFKLKINDEERQEPIEKIIFDFGEKYCALLSQTQIKILNIKLGGNQDVFTYNMPELYDQILDMVLDSRKCGRDKFKCTIACGWETGRKIIGIFEINDDNNPEKIRSILCTEWGTNMSCKISDDAEQVVFSNGKEHYILKGKSQDFFPHIGEKTIRSCINYNDQFYFVNSSDQYDRDIVIQNSKNKFYKAKINRSLEPGQIKVFDTSVQHLGQNNCILKILMYQGDYLFLDIIDLYQSNDMKLAKYQAHLSTCIDKKYMAYGFNWPYFSYASQNNYIFILNAFNPNFVQRYELPKNVVRCDKTFLTDSHDLYAICETENGFEVYNVDLDSLDPYLEGPLLKYSSEQVEGQPLTDFHVRASSRKEKINLNKALIFFMMHGSKFYGWCETDGCKVTTVMSFCEDPDPFGFCSNYYYLSDDSLFFLTTKSISIGKKNVLHSEIMFVECQFGSYKVTNLYQDKDSRAEILNFGVDNTNNRLLILSGVKNSKDKRDKFLTLYSFNRDKIIFSMRIKSPEIIGRLKSNLYNFVGGHIYYNNKVIKIRYDLLDVNYTMLDLKEDKVFDHYSNVLAIDKDDEVQSDTPLQTCLYHRLAYVIRNQKKLKARKVLVLPYLHERKIYLNTKHNANQFYNLVKHQNGMNYITCLQFQDNKMYIYSETGILIDRIDYSQLAEIYGKPICISENGTVLIFRKGQDNPEIHLVYIHFDKLEFIETINLKKRIESYFKKDLDEKNEVYLEEQFKETGYNITKKGCCGRKKDECQDEMKEKVKKDKHFFYENYLGELENMKDVKIEFILNDDAEVLVRLRPKKYSYDEKPMRNSNDLISIPSDSNVFTERQKEKEANEKQNEEKTKENSDDHNYSDEFKNRSFLYFFPVPNVINARKYCKQCFSCSEEGQEIENQKDENDNTPEGLESREFIYFDSAIDEVYDLQGLSMNQDFIFFWNTGKVWKMHIATQILTEIGIYIDEDEQETYIIRARTSSNKSRVGIRVRQSPTMDCFIIWDLWRDVEIDSFDINNSSIFLQDRLGNMYMAENDYLINTEKQCKLKSYRFSVDDFEIPQYSFGSGYRVDDKLHNYVLMRNYASLSFSYMTFIIKRNFDKGGYLRKDFLFDQEGYDYILKRNTVFTEGTLITQDYDKLHFILNSFAKLDVVLLEQLFYRNNQGDSPLHIAVSVNNTRMVNLILQFLAKINNSGIGVIKNIFKELIDYKDFPLYLMSAPFQSLQMEQKQTLMLKQTATQDDIIKVTPSSCSYVDVAYFEEVMGEDKQRGDFKTYACKISCVRADWILKDQDGIGMEFLQSMLKKKNRDVFMTPYMKIIIEFLYEKYSERIKLVLLPPYLAHLAFVNIQLFVNEHKRDIMEQMVHDDNDLIVKQEYKKALAISNAVVCICGGINFLNMLVFLMQSKSMGLQVFYRLWSVVDMIIICTNFATLINLLANFGTRYIRIIECILVFSQWFKCLYYMRLVAEISPLIESIFVILNDMSYFLLIFIIGIFAFSEAFFTIGKNQAMLKEEELDAAGTPHIPMENSPSYATIGGALSDTYMSALGQLDISEYGDSQMTPILYFLFILLSFIMCIHLLNMLIAIMGQSFDRNAEIADSNRKINQLEFVVNNWWIHPIKKKGEIVYFVAAFAIKDEDDKETKLDNMESELKEMRTMILNQYQQMSDIQYQISQLQVKS